MQIEFVFAMMRFSFWRFFNAYLIAMLALIAASITAMLKKSTSLYKMCLYRSLRLYR